MQSETSTNLSQSTRIDAPEFDPSSVWIAMSNTPGVGVSIIDVEGRLLYVNPTSMKLFMNADRVDYEGKSLGDFHPPEFVRERLVMIRRVVEEQRPLIIQHIYHGVGIASTVWPIRDAKPPFNRTITISKQYSDAVDVEIACSFETVKTEFIDLGPLSVLTRRELEVLALLGQGISVPKAAAILHRSPKTVERHKTAIGEKLHLRGQSELVAMVSAMGLDISDAHLTRFKMIQK